MPEVTSKKKVLRVVPRREIMDEIVPHLYIGSLPTCLEMTSLRQSHIKSIVSCMYDPPSLPESYDIKDENLLNVPVDDVEDIPIFLYFGQCCRFLEQRLHDSNEASNGSVLVYCQAGSSRSVTVRVAFELMLDCCCLFDEGTPMDRRAGPVVYEIKAKGS